MEELIQESLIDQKHAGSLIKTLAQLVLEGASRLTDDQRGKVNEGSRGNPYDAVCYELMLFFVYYISRNCRILDDERRVIFIGLLCIEVEKNLYCDKPNDDDGRRYSQIVAAYNERQKTYEQHEKMFSKKVEDFEGWEFGQKISALIGKESSGVVSIKIQSVLADIAKALELDKVFNVQ